MSETVVVKAIFRIRRDIAANWTSANPILKQGEFGFEADTGRLKVGDGSVDWAGLNYVTPGWSAAILALASLAIGSGKVPYFTSGSAASTFDSSSFMRGLMSSSDAAAVFTALGVTDLASRLSALESSAVDQGLAIADHDARISALEGA